MANNPDKPAKANPNQKPTDQPTGVREPSNTRSPTEPTPRQPQKPYSAKAEEEEDEGPRPTDAQTEGM